MILSVTVRRLINMVFRIKPIPATISTVAPTASIPRSSDDLSLSTR